MKTLKTICSLVPLILFISTSTLSATTLKMGILPVIDTLPLQVAVQEKLFDAEGLSVQLIPFKSAMERNTAFHSKKLDGFFGDMIATLLIVKNDIPLKLLTVSYRTDPKQRMFGLMLSPHLNPAQANPTLTVAISKASIIEYLLDHMQKFPEVENIRFTYTEIKQMPIRLQMLLAGEMDAALLPEPLATLAESKGAKAVITDKRFDMPLTILNLHASKMKAKKRFLAAYKKAVERINADPENYRRLMAKTCRIPKSLEKSFPVYHYPLPTLPTPSEVDHVQQWMIKKGLLTQKIPYHQLVDE